MLGWGKSGVTVQKPQNFRCMEYEVSESIVGLSCNYVSKSWWCPYQNLTLGAFCA